MKHIKNTHQTHFRVMKKIYPKKWLELHPYKQTNSVDQYYVGIENEIHKRLYSSTIADAFEEEENIRYTSLCLAAWFEDVISQTGIWQAFTAECRKRYGAYLPFYPIKGDYFPDEINLEDIRFLLWHHIQYLCRGISAINPENPGIEQTAQEIYGLLAEEYETAPENERMQEFLYHSAMGEEDFFRYREILDWFHYQCYFNIENVAQCRDEAERLLDDEKITPEMERAACGACSAFGTGGMQTKLSAAKIATEAGVSMIIANGSHPSILYDWMDGKPIGTKFLAKERKSV